MYTKNTEGFLFTFVENFLAWEMYNKEEIIKSTFMP